MDPKCPYCDVALNYLTGSQGIMSKFISAYSCLSSTKPHISIRNFFRCELCGNLCGCECSSWKEFIVRVKRHLRQEHKIFTNNEFYIGIGNGYWTGSVVGIDDVYFTLPDYISIFISSNISDLLKYSYKKYLHFHITDEPDDSREILPFEWVKIACTICGGEFDSISREICESHTYNCIRNYTGCENRQEL